MRKWLKPGFHHYTPELNRLSTEWKAKGERRSKDQKSKCLPESLWPPLGCTWYNNHRL
jgi:hypothetical protein